MNGVTYNPGYIALHRSGELHKRGEALWEIMRECRLCPRECRVNRLEGETGFCKATSNLRVASYSSHFGEERPLVGFGGSGTIFFSHCNLGCVFCQNWDISHRGSGTDCEIEDLAAMMLTLQEQGCGNIKIVPLVLLRMMHTLLRRALTEAKHCLRYHIKYYQPKCRTGFISTSILQSPLLCLNS